MEWDIQTKNTGGGLVMKQIKSILLAALIALSILAVFHIPAPALA